MTSETSQKGIFNSKIFWGKKFDHRKKAAHFSTVLIASANLLYLRIKLTLEICIIVASLHLTAATKQDKTRSFKR